MLSFLKEVVIMIDFGYEIWKETCEEVLEYAKTHGKYYIQLYPFLNRLEELSNK